MDALANLPDLVLSLVPAADGFDWVETRADCANCVMLASAGVPADLAFIAATRCCTYHPLVPNFLLGNALRRSARARRLISARMDDPSGVSSWGIVASQAWSERHSEVGSDGWGRDLALRCPYWVGGDETCGIWADRNGACRCWYCKHDTGPRAALLWMRMQLLLERIERRLADLCQRRGQAPTGGGAELLAWYAWCADYIDAVDAADVDALRTELTPLVDLLAEVAARPPRSLPEVVVATVGEVQVRGDEVQISGYSSFDALTLPRSVFAFLALLDGERGWRQALAESGSALGQAQVVELYRVGALVAPGEELVTDTWILPVRQRGG